MINNLCIERHSLHQPGRGNGPSTPALRARQRFVFGELTERVIIVIDEIEKQCPDWHGWFSDRPGRVLGASIIALLLWPALVKHSIVWFTVVSIPGRLAWRWQKVSTKLFAGAGFHDTPACGSGWVNGYQGGWMGRRLC